MLDWLRSHIFNRGPAGAGRANVQDGILQSIIEQHRDLREMLRDVERLCERVIAGKAYLSVTLGEYMRALHEQLLDHLDLEDERLVPELRAVDSWGQARAESLLEHHRGQRSQLRAALGDLEEARVVTSGVAHDVLSLIADLRIDMQQEEGEILPRFLARDVTLGDVPVE
jgi:iron-sulfur cluster repair protein YtfE (RIC family)